MAQMLGRSCPEGPGGRDCACCGQAPGIKRTKARRLAKRRERRAVARKIRRALTA